MLDWVRKLFRHKVGAEYTPSPTAHMAFMEERLLDEVIAQNAWLRAKVDSCHKVLVAGSWRNRFEEEDAVRRNELALAQIKASMTVDAARAGADARYTDAANVLQQ